MSDPSPDECLTVTEGWKLLKKDSRWRSAHWINKFIDKFEDDLSKYGFEKKLRVSSDYSVKNFRERIDGMLGLLEFIVEAKINEK